MNSDLWNAGGRTSLNPGKQQAISETPESPQASGSPLPSSWARTRVFFYRFNSLSLQRPRGTPSAAAWERPHWVSRDEISSSWGCLPSAAAATLIFPLPSFWFSQLFTSSAFLSMTKGCWDSQDAGHKRYVVCLPLEVGHSDQISRLSRNQFVKIISYPCKLWHTFFFGRDYRNMAFCLGCGVKTLVPKKPKPRQGHYWSIIYHLKNWKSLRVHTNSHTQEHYVAIKYYVCKSLSWPGKVFTQIKH